MKKQINTFLFILLGLLLSISSCSIVVNDDDNDNDKNTIYGTGALITYNQTLDAFTKISLTGQAKIKVIKGETLSVVVKAQQNIYDVLDIHVSDGKLFIRLKNNYSISTNEGIYIDIVSPSAINDVEMVGAGDLNISGSTQESFNAIITGAGKIYAYGLEVNHAKIIISGAADCSVKVNNTLNVIISGAGTVRYKGTPTITQTIAGVGSVVNDN